MRQFTIILAAAVVSLAACSSPDDSGAERTHTPSPLTTGTAPAPPTSPGGARAVATGLAVPWAIAFLPGGDALVTERDTASLVRVSPSGRRTQLGKVPGVEPLGEGGLLGVAVSPSYASDHLIYMYFTAASDNRVVRATLDGSLGALQPVVTGIPKGSYHNGGRLAFGPDRMLYVTTGETGDKPLAQDRGSLAGKILRVTPDGRPAPGNPFGNRTWTYGHRNVQGLAWDDQGRLYATEFGQDTYDEINRIEKGRNYGWPEVEGFGDNPRYTNPLLTWSTDEASPSGLAYAGGSLWAAALRGKRLWQVPLKDGRAGRPVARYRSQYGRIRAAVKAPDGTLWITTSNKDGRGDPARDDDRIISVPTR